MDGAAARPLDMPLLERARWWLAGAMDAGSSHAVSGAWHARMVRTADAVRLPDVPLLQESEHRAVVRLSRAGIPSPLPDVLGVSLRLFDVGAPGVTQDFVLASSMDAPLLHRVPVPARWRTGVVFSSLLPYEVGGRTLHVGVRISRAPRGLARGNATGAEFEFVLASATDRFRAVAQLRLTSPLSAREVADLHFDPWPGSEGVRPSGLANGLRRAVRRGSR